MLRLTTTLPTKTVYLAASASRVQSFSKRQRSATSVALLMAPSPERACKKHIARGLNYDRIMSPTLVSELRLAVSHYHNVAQPTDYGKNDPRALGIPGVNINQFTSGMVGIQINDGFSNPLTGYSASLPWIRAEANVDIVNTWTKTIGNHTIKWGGDLKRVRDDLLQDQTFSPRGIYYFGAQQTALATLNGAALRIVQDGHRQRLRFVLARHSL